jgi:hypothetical protein
VLETFVELAVLSFEQRVNDPAQLFFSEKLWSSGVVAVAVPIFVFGEVEPGFGVADSVLGDQVLPRLENLADLLVRLLVSLGSAFVVESPAFEGA